jgi:sugar O-acyltransferase (sialic acid O-acetyltransferase NeuD family)
MVPKVVIWGAGGQAIVVADIVRLRGELELVGFLDDVSRERTGTMFCQAPVLGGREQLDRLRDRGVDHVIIGFGNNAARLTCGELARSMGYRLATAIHPRAIIAAGSRIGAGTVIKGGAVIDPDVTIGEHVILGSCVCIGHGSVLEDGVRVSAAASVAGHVTIGRATAIGPGASFKDRVRVGQYSLVGVGSVVVRDIPDRVIAYGVPARVMRPIIPDETRD